MFTTPEGLAAEFSGKAFDAERRAGLAVRATLVGVTADGKQGAPVDTGFLRSSITWEMTGSTEGEAGPEAVYGGFLETGTSRMGAQPYMGPAADRWEPQFRQALDSVVGFEGVVRRVTPGR